MRFRKLLSLSAVLTVGLMMGGAFSVRKSAPGADAATDSIKTNNIVMRPDLKFKIDTLNLTDQNYDSLIGSAAAGQFVPKTNTIRMTYFYSDSTASDYVKNYCNSVNCGARAVMRHEIEHARKAYLIQNRGDLSPWNRARVVAMNESMAPAGEIIESQEYRLETGERFPRDRSFLWRADSLIMARHNQMNYGRGESRPVDFSDPVIADMVLDFAVDNFAGSHKRGYYKKRIKEELAGAELSPYTPNNRCYKILSTYAPEYDQWGAMWTYDVSAPWGVRRQVDIWNSATAAARQRALNKIDSIIMSDMEPGQKLNPVIFEKPR